MQSKLYPLPAREKSLKNPARHSQPLYDAPAADVEFAGHAVHPSVPPSEYCPARQLPHVAEPAPDTSPAAHGLQVASLVALSVAEAVPGGHLEHLSPDEPPSNVPAGHGWHPSAPACAKKPAPHTSHTEDPDLDAAPAPHGVQDSAPPVENVPGPQGLQPPLPLTPTAPENVPAGQETHAALPWTDLYLPIPHASHHDPSAPVYPGRHTHCVFRYPPGLCVVD